MTQGTAPRPLYTSDLELVPDDKSRAWRTEELIKAGASKQIAGMIADKGEINLHKAVEMLRQTDGNDELVWLILS
jgi:hypothetical protein